MKMETARNGTESQDVTKDLSKTVQKTDSEQKRKDKKEDATTNLFTGATRTKKIGSEYWLG